MTYHVVGAWGTCSLITTVVCTSTICSCHSHPLHILTMKNLEALILYRNSPMPSYYRKNNVKTLEALADKTHSYWQSCNPSTLCEQLTTMYSSFSAQSLIIFYTEHVVEYSLLLQPSVQHHALTNDSSGFTLYHTNTVVIYLPFGEGFSDTLYSPLQLQLLKMKVLNTAHNTF